MSENPHPHTDRWTRDGLLPGDDYDPASYWEGVGAIYESYCNVPAYGPQEAVFARLLADLDWTTVLDVGCGFGRLGTMVKGIRPHARYTGMDVAPGQLANAAKHLPEAEFVCAELLTFDPSRTWEIVICAEVLMHQPPADIGPIIDRMLGWSDGLVVFCEWDDIDYFERTGDPPSTWNFPHDYRALLGGRLVSEIRVGDEFPWSGQTIFVAKG